MNRYIARKIEEAKARANARQDNVALTDKIDRINREIVQLKIDRHVATMVMQTKMIEKLYGIKIDPVLFTENGL